MNQGERKDLNPTQTVGGQGSIPQPQMIPPQVNQPNILPSQGHNQAGQQIVQPQIVQPQIAQPQIMQQQPFQNANTSQQAVNPQPTAPSMYPPQQTINTQSQNTQVQYQPQVGPGNNQTNQSPVKEEVPYKPPSKIKIVFLFLFLIITIVFVFFLPEITEMVDRYQNTEPIDDTIIEDGDVEIKLLCLKSTTTTNLDKDYSFTYNFKNYKLETAELVTITSGDASLDGSTLNSLYTSCKNLKEQLINQAGIDVKCNLQTDKVEEIENYDLSKVTLREITPFIAESGGFVLNYSYHEDIDKIETDMKNNGYNCHRG